MNRESREPISSVDADVLVIGAGPAGLAAALEAKRIGADRVIVLDRLAQHSRCRSIILDSEVLALLEGWGVNLAGINDVDTFTYVHGYGESSKADCIPFPKLNPFATTDREPWTPGAYDILFRRLPRAVQQIRDLEAAMLDAARPQGVDVLFNSTVTTRPEADHRSVRLVYETDGSEVEVNCEFLVVADGSRSRVSKLLGLRRIPCNMPSYRYTCTVFDSARRDVLLYWVPEHPSGITEMTGLGNGSKYTLVSRLPAEFTEEPHIDLRESSLPGMIRQAASSIGIHGPLSEGPMPFGTDMDRLEEVAVDPRILCVGDAARKGDPGFGGNMNEAIRDGKRVGAYLSAARDPNETSRTALQTFREEVQGATRALQTGGALTNNMRSFFAIGDSAQAYLPAPLRSLIHFDVSILMRATGTMVGLMNSTRRATERNR